MAPSAKSTEQSVIDPSALDPNVSDQDAEAIGDQAALNSLLGAAGVPGQDLPGAAPVGAEYGVVVDANVSPIAYDTAAVKDHVAGGKMYVVVAQHVNVLVTPPQPKGFPAVPGRVILADKGDVITLGDDDAKRPLALGTIVAVK